MDDIEQAIELYRQKKREASVKAYQKRREEHEKEKKRNLHMRLDRRRDADIIKWIDTHRPISKEIRVLIRALIAKEENEGGKRA